MDTFNRSTATTISTSTRYNKPLFNKKCRVCGDKATCLNFNGLSCETCKIFFRRNAAQPDKLRCKRNGNCPIDYYTRKCCPKCRLDKCFSIGMRLRFVRSRRNSMLIDNERVDEMKKKGSNWNRHQTELINKRTESSQKECSPTILNEYDCQLLNEIELAANSFVDEQSLPIVDAISNLHLISIKLLQLYSVPILKYCQSISAFNMLQASDKLLVYNSIYFKLLSIRFAFNYNLENDCFPILENATNSQSTLVMYKNILTESNRIDTLMVSKNLIQTLKFEMDNDPMIRDLLITQILFKPIVNLSCADYFRYHYCVYRHLLVKYLEHKYQNPTKACRKYSKLMSLINDQWSVDETIRQLLENYHNMWNLEKLSNIHT
ncbi:zinc ion binding [Blomia tropicalis]|nr:zinc ion binding [Blomia tropicalis]